jgi:hypothetical protein
MTYDLASTDMAMNPTINAAAVVLGRIVLMANVSARLTC